jgi:hypothetical protein
VEGEDMTESNESTAEPTVSEQIVKWRCRTSKSDAGATECR